MQKLSQKLVSLRKNKNLTQQQLAEKINYSNKVISKWECGESIPDISALYLLAKFYETTIDELMNTCDLVKSDEPQSQLKKLGILIHIILTLLPIIFLTMYICIFGHSIANVIYIHDFNSILLLVLLVGISVLTIVDMILCQLKLKRNWVAYFIFGLICALILLLIISCILYGTFTVSASLGLKESILSCVLSIISVAYGYIFYKK